MSYEIFNVEKNIANANENLRVVASKAKRSERELMQVMGGRVIESDLDTQRLANERHNEAMLKKDIEIAELKGQLKALS